MNKYTLFVGAATLFVTGFIFNHHSDLSMAVGLIFMGLASNE